MKGMRRRVIKRSAMVPVRIQEDMLKELDIIAMRQNRYRSELIREAIKDFLKKSKFLIVDR